jgi:hypothetical protein
MNKLTLLVIMMLCGSLFSFGQSIPQPASQLAYFEFASLDFNKYAELHEAVKADGNFLIETACIPAKVISVKKVNVNSNFEAFKQLASLSGLSATEWLQGQQQNAFDQRCLNARTGN